MESISKPHMVDLLRIFDKKRWITPRIRYASVRSKPELIADLKRVFFTAVENHEPDIIHFKLRAAVRRSHSHLPEISYSLKNRTFLFDGLAYNVPVESRRRVEFSISRVPVTLFGTPIVSPLSI